MNKIIKTLFTMIMFVLLWSQICISIVSAQGFDEIPSMYFQSPSFSFKDNFAPPVNGANYVASPSWQSFNLPQKTDYMLADSKFVIPPGISKIIMVIDNSIYNSPSTPSGQCNMLSFRTGAPDASLDVVSNAIGILLQQDKSAFWAGQKSFRFGWNGDKTTFTLTMPDKNSPDYNSIKKTGLWCYMKTASCQQQMFSYNIQMIIRDLEEYKAWYELMSANDQGWDFAGNPVSDLSVLSQIDPVLPDCTSIPDKLNVIDQANITAEAPVIFNNNTFTLNTPSYCDRVDIYLAIIGASGKLIFVDSTGNLTLDFSPYAAGSTSAINTSFSVAGSALAAELTGECVLYWLIAPANGGNIIQSLYGAFDLGFYGFYAN